MATAGATLPDDVILEIVARLEEASAIFRCAATCRRWRALLSQPAFLRPLWPDRSFIGFFTNEWRRGEGVSFVPVPRSTLGAGRRFLSSYIPDAPTLSDWVLPLASHHGLLLVRLFPRNSRHMQLAVCDPLAGKWDVLPTLSMNEATDFVGYAIVATGADCSSPLSSFRVLLVRTDKYGQDYLLYHFSSDCRRWRIPVKWPDDLERILRRSTIAHMDAVVCHSGVAFWLVVKLTNLYILSVDSQTCYVALTQLLITVNHHERFRLTTTTDGTLLSLCTYDGDRSVEIWEQQYTDGNVSWLCTKVLKLRLQLQGARCMCLGARSGRLVLMDRHQRVYVLDLKGGAMEEMNDKFDDPNLTAVPMEIDWPVFFMSQLRPM
ncbi:unnamed protein product [Alopecurus aequalis]